MNKFLVLIVLLSMWSVSVGRDYTDYDPQIGDDRCDPEWYLENFHDVLDWTSEFQMLDQENNKPYVGSAALYYDPETPGIGLEMTIQQSVHSSTGYFGAGVFYAYNEDGSQAWYPVDGAYQPTYNDEDAYWQYDTEFFGVHVSKGSTLFHTEDELRLYKKAYCWWGHDDTYLGELSSPLVKTSGGAVVDGAYSPHQMEKVGDLRLRWLSPDKVEVYLNGASTPQHTFIRNKFYSGTPERKADFLLDNSYYVNVISWGGLSKKHLPGCWDHDNNVPADPEWGCLNLLLMNYHKGVVEFERFDHRTDMPNNNTPGLGEDWSDTLTAVYPDNYAAQRFHRMSAWVPRHVNYVSKECLPIRMDFVPHSPLATPLADSVGNFGMAQYFDSAADWCAYVLMSYDPLYDELSAYLAQAWYEDNDISRGLEIIPLGFKYKAPLPQSDSALINLFPATDWSSNNSADATAHFMNRSHFTMHRLPKLGGLFKDLPNIYIDGWNLDVERGE